MTNLYHKWWFWVLIVIAVLIILALLPIWCTTYFLPDRATQTVTEQVSCGPIWNLFKVY